MASIRNLKKEMNTALSEIIEDCYVCQLNGDDKTAAKAEKIIDEAITAFDELIVKLHQKEVEDQKAHMKAIRASLLEKTGALSKKLSKLSD